MKKNLFWRLLMLLVAVLAVTPGLAQAEPLDNWHWKNPLPQGNTIRGMVYDGGQYLAVGDYGAIVTSADGSNWINRTQLNSSQSGTRNALKSAAFATVGGKLTYVAVGDNGTILSSQPVDAAPLATPPTVAQPAGAVWSVRVSNTSANFTSVAYGDGYFVAVAQDGTFVASADGATWSAPVRFTADSVNAVTYGDPAGSPTFVAVTNNGNIYASTTPVTAATWVKTETRTSNSLRSVTFDGSRFLASGVGGTLLVSDNGVEWSVQGTSGFGDDDYNAIVFSDSTYLVCGDNGALLTSSDAASWTARASQTTRPLFAIAGKGSASGTFMAGGGNGELLTSTDSGVSWASKSTNAVNPSRHLQGIASGNGHFVAVGTGSTVLTLSDLVKRTAAGSFNGVAYGNNTFIAAGALGDMFASIDGGLNWFQLMSSDLKNFPPKLSDGTTSQTVNGVGFGGGKFVAVGAFGSVTFTSDNGHSWAPATVGSMDLNGVAYGAGTFVAVGAAGTIMTSPDATAWSAQLSSTVERLSAVAYGSSNFVAVGARGTILVSSDGRSWSKIASPSSGDLNGISYGNGVFTAVGQDAAKGIVLTSGDNGATWTERTSGSASPLYAVAFGNNVFYAVGANGTIIYSDFVPSPPATVTSTTPADGAVGVAVTSPVTATFSSDMDDSTITTASFTLKDAGNKAVAGAVGYDPLTMRATFTPALPLGSNQAYTATLSTAVKDRSGNSPGSAKSWRFSTADTTPPALVSTAPAAGAIDVPVSSTVSATFSKQLQPSTVNGFTFAVSDSAGKPVAGTVSYSGLTATFKASQDLLPGITYSVRLAGITDPSGNPLPASTWNFSTTPAYTITVATVGTGTVTPGTVTVYKGGWQAFLVEPGAGYGLDDLTLDGASVKNQMVGNGYAVLNVSADHTLVASFKKTYRVFTSATGNGAVTVYSKSGAGAGQLDRLALKGLTALNSDHGRLYWNLAATSGTRAFSLYKDPAGGDSSLVATGSSDSDGAMTLSSANNSGITGSVEISYQADSLSTASNVVQVATITEEISPGMVTVDSADTQYLTFTPEAGYVVAAVSDGGAALPKPLPASYTLSDISADHYVVVLFGIDATPPTVTAVTPLGGASNLSPATTITATFNKPVYVTDSFIVKDAAGNAILGTISSSGLTATFTPSYPLALNTEYTVTLTAGVHDTFGNHLASPYLWKFTVAKDVQYLTAMAGANGAISPSGLVPVPKGSRQTFDITTDPLSYAKTGSALLDITIDGVSIGTGKLPPRNPLTGSYSYTTDPVMADHVVGAIFTSATHTLTVQSKIFGVVTNGHVHVGLADDTIYDYNYLNLTVSSADETVAHGAYTTWTILPDPGYYLSSITFNGIRQNIPTPNTDGSYTYITPAIVTDATLLCTFTSSADASNSNSLTMQAGPGGSFFYGSTAVIGGYNTNGTFKSAMVSALPDAQLTVRITTDSGYALASLLANGEPVAAGRFPSRQPDGSYRFTTDPINAAGLVLTATFAVDTTKPLVIRTVPANGTTEVAILQPVIAATFSKQIKESSITPVNFAVKESVSGDPVAGTLSYDSASQTATFTPTLPLTLATSYTVSLTTGISDVYGNALASSSGKPSSFTFTTRSESHNVSLTVGDNGAVTSSPAANASVVQVADNNSVVLTITPSTTGAHPWYGLGSIKVDDVAVPLPARDADGHYYFTLNNVIANHRVDVQFVKLTHTITATAGSFGSVSGSLRLDVGGRAVVDDADSITLTLTPSSGFGLSSLSDNGAPVNLAVPPPGLRKALSPNPDGTYNWLYTVSGITADHVIVAGFANSYRITVSAGSGGSITPGSSTVSYASDKSFTITADTGYRITGVWVNGEMVTASSETSFRYTFANVTTDQTLSATFAPYQNHIDVLPSASGTIFPSGVIYRNPGTASTFTITPAIGYSLSTILLDGVEQPAPAMNAADGSYSYVVAASEKSSTLSATFTLKKFAVTMTTGANGSLASGSIVAAFADNDKTVTIAYGGAATFRVIPAPGYYLKEIKVDGVSVMESLVNQSITLQNVTTNHTVTAVFDIKYRITASAGPNGTISPPGTVLYNAGDTPVYLFAPATGYQVQSVKVDGVPLASVPQESYSFPAITKDIAIEVAFVLKTFTVKMADAVQHGSMHPSSVTLSYGGSQSFTLVPDQGYRLKDVKIGDTSVFSEVQSNILTLNRVTADQTITPAFEPVLFAITLQAGAGGKISGNTEISYDQDATFTITPDANYGILDVKVDGVSVKSQMNGSTYTLASVRGVHTVSATFAINTFVIRASAGNGGSITPAGNTTLNYGTTQLYTVAPADGYMLDDVKLDNVSVKSSLVDGTFTVSGIAADHAIAATFTPLVYPDGDLNGDGKITVEDALIALQMAVGIRVPTRDEIAHGDVAPLTATGKPKPNAKIDVADALVLLQRTVGNIKAW